MKNTFVLSTILIFLFTATAFAQDFSIKAEVDKTILSTDQALTYRIIIISSDKKIPQPRLPKFEGFKVVSQAQSSNIAFIKNNIKTTLVYRFILVPSDIGKFKIGPSTIKIRNKIYSSDTFEIEVKPGKSKPKIKPEKKPSQPEERQPETEQPQITL